MVAGLRSLPNPMPPPDFKSRVLARWEAERNEAVEITIVSMESAPTDASERPTATAPSAVQNPLPAWGPPRQNPYRPPSRAARSVRPFHGFAVALFAMIFACGMLTGKSWYSSSVIPSDVVPNAASVHNFVDKMREAVDLRLEPSQQVAALRASDAHATPSLPTPTLPDVSPQQPAAELTECPGRTNEWNPTTLHMVVRPPMQQDLRDAEVAVWVPNNVRVAFASNEYSSGQLVLIRANVGSNGEWMGAMRWRALQAGRFAAWVETHYDGVYQRRPIVFNVTP